MSCCSALPCDSRPKRESDRLLPNPIVWCYNRLARGGNPRDFVVCPLRNEAPRLGGGLARGEWYTEGVSGGMQCLVTIWSS